MLSAYSVEVVIPVDDVFVDCFPFLFLEAMPSTHFLRL